MKKHDGYDAGGRQDKETPWRSVARRGVIIQRVGGPEAHRSSLQCVTISHNFSISPKRIAFMSQIDSVYKYIWYRRHRRGAGDSSIARKLRAVSAIGRLSTSTARGAVKSPVSDRAATAGTLVVPDIGLLRQTIGDSGVGRS